MCHFVYNDDGCAPVGTVWCSNKQRHKRTVMVVRDEYQCILDDMGIPLDDPLRLA